MNVCWISSYLATDEIQHKIVFQINGGVTCEVWTMPEKSSGWDETWEELLNCLLEKSIVGNQWECPRGWWKDFQNQQQISHLVKGKSIPILKMKSLKKDPDLNQQGQMAVMRRLRDLALLNPAYLSQLFLSSAQPNVSSIRAEEDLDQNIITTTNTINQRFLMSEVLQLR